MPFAHRAFKTDETEEANAQSALGQLNRGRVLPLKKKKNKEADRGVDGKLRNGSHTTQAREHILAASIALSGEDLAEAGRRIDSARIHASHSQHKDAPGAIEDLNNAHEHVLAKRPHEASKLLDSAYGKLQGEANLLLKAKTKPKEVKESLGHVMSSRGNLRETVTTTSRFIEGSYRPDVREVDVLIIDSGLGNLRDKHFYYPDTIKQAVSEKVFEGAQCYADHPGKDEDINRPERSIRDLVGYFKNSRVMESKDGRVGYVATLKVHQGVDWALGLIKEAIDYNKDFPNNVLVGISINADGDITPDEIDGQSVNGVKRITEAFSADIVTKPGRGGKMLALVESDSGAHDKESGMKFKSLQEAAAFLEQLADGDSVDPADLKEAARYIREAKAKEDGEIDGDADDKVAKKVVKEDEATKEAVKVDKNGDDDASDEEQEDTEDKPMSGKKMNSTPKESSSLGGSNLRETHATLFASALAEAKSMVGNNLSQLQRENAELKAEKELRESIQLASKKLKESTLPEGAFEAVMNDLIGHSDVEMDRIIESEVRRASAYGFKPSKQTSGNGQRQPIDLRESDVRSNTALLLADVVEV